MGIEVKGQADHVNLGGAGGGGGGGDLWSLSQFPTSPYLVIKHVKSAQCLCCVQLKASVSV